MQFFSTGHKFFPKIHSIRRRVASLWGWAALAWNGLKSKWKWFRVGDFRVWHSFGTWWLRCLCWQPFCQRRHTVNIHNVFYALFWLVSRQAEEASIDTYKICEFFAKQMQIKMSYYICIIKFIRKFLDMHTFCKIYTVKNIM